MTIDRLSSIFAALADPTRRAILARLIEGDATVSELAEPFTISLPAVSRHLRVLEQAGLIEQTRSAQWRSNRLRAGSLREVADWMAAYRPYWDAAVDRPGAHPRRSDTERPTQPTHPTGRG